METLTPINSHPRPQELRPISENSEESAPKTATAKTTQLLSIGIEDPEEAVPHLHLKTYLTVFSVCLIYFSQLINVVGAGARAQDIAHVLGDGQKSVWLTSSITIFTVVLSPPVSQAADYWGRRWFLIILTAFGAVGSIIVSRATTMNMAIAGQCVAGISYGAQPLLHSVTSEVVPRKYRPLAQATNNVACAVGGLFALIVGGAMTRGNPAGFRNYWYMAAGFYAVAAILCVILYNPPQRPSQRNLTHMQKLKKLDWVGYFLLASGLVLFCIGLSWSQNPYRWTDEHILAPFLIGLALVAALAVYETKYKKDGMFHHALFSQGWNFVIALLCISVEGLVFFAANNYFAFEVAVLYETDPLIIGLRYGITFIVYAIFAVGAGIVCSTTKRTKLPTVAAFGFIIIFFICMVTATPKSSTNVWGFPVFLGAGLGICLCAIVAVAQLSTPAELISITSGLLISVRSLGGTVGLAIYNPIFTEKFTSNLGPEISKAVLPLGLPSTSLPALIEGLAANNETALGLVPGATPNIIAAGVGGLFEAYAIGFRFVWISAGCFTVAAAVLAVFLVDPVKEFNMHIDAPAEKKEDLYDI